MASNYIVFKFGGASVKDAAGVQNLRRIVEQFSNRNLFVVISAVGKTTNLLERVLDAYFYKNEDWNVYYNQLKDNHFSIAEGLMDDCSPIISKLTPILSELKLKLQQTPSDNYEYEYDQIVSFGEILSTTLISTYLNEVGLQNQWIDVRQMLLTDHSYTEAKLDWDKSASALSSVVNSAAKDGKIFVTQGFIAGAGEGVSTTFGREGSDYSAAIIAYLLDAESVTIWKDVPGLLSADPKYFPEAVKLDAISYEEAIELSYYGATIIHPKTLKPLQNKNIPLYIKPFLEPTASGSVISALGHSDTIPSYIFKRDQILITIFPKDFSFISVDNLSEIFAVLSQNSVKINLMQNTALSFSVCTDNKPRKIQNVLSALNKNFLIKYNEKMELITVRHYTDPIVDKVVAGRTVYAEQRSRSTVQIVVKESE